MSHTEPHWRDKPMPYLTEGGHTLQVYAAAWRDLAVKMIDKLERAAAFRQSQIGSQRPCEVGWQCQWWSSLGVGSYLAPEGLGEPGWHYCPFCQRAGCPKRDKPEPKLIQEER